MNKAIALNANPLVTYLNKLPNEFTKADIIQYVKENNIHMVDFMYPAEDGRVKTLNFVINDLEYLETILSLGERVDSSSLFPSYVEAGNSDLYVIPRFSTAFLDPFAEIPTVALLCDFFEKSGEPFAGSPSNTLQRAAKRFHDCTGMDFEAMGELEYYVIDQDDELFRATDQRGYHESAPYAKYNGFRQKCIEYIAKTGGRIKYGHAEVGNFHQDHKVYEQNEIEFLPCPVLSAADQITLAKWVIRNLAYEEGLDVTFAPKITVGKAGSGMHIHMRLTKDGRNRMTRDGRLSDEARKAIAGMMELAPSITSFGNMNPTSYFRLVPNQEAPTSVCWGDRNRSVLVRVPLGWIDGVDMCCIANPLEEQQNYDTAGKQTVEMRSPDASADIYFLLAGLCVACTHGFQMPNALEVAEATYVSGDIHKAKDPSQFAHLKHLPASCVASAQCLEKQRAIYEADGVFSPKAIDGIIKKLKAMDDDGLYARIKEDKEALAELVHRYYHCG